jgi:hypothetical protein
LTKFSYEALLLKPLHKTLYQRLSCSPWLCRGDPTSDKLRRAGFRAGKGVLVSGDYASATDNLPIAVAERVLEVAFRNSVFVPDSVKRHAMASLRPDLWSLRYGLSFKATTGQMMGSFLSFPLLCFQNYLAFKWSCLQAGLKVRPPLLINGDDILFQSTSEFAQLWMGVVGDVGLEVEQSKTSVSESFGTLNSTLFEWDSGFLTVRPTARFGMLRSCDYSVSLGANFGSFLRGFRPELWFNAAKVFFRWHLPRLRDSRLTLDEMGFRGSLAWRMAGIFSLLPRDLSVVQPPKVPCPHNCHLPSGGAVVEVPRGSLTDELRDLGARQMTAWRWEHEFESVSAVLQYCLALSRVRSPRSVLSTVGESLRPVGFGALSAPTYRALRGRFFRPLSRSLGEIVFSEVLQTQELGDYCPLPTYGEAEACLYGLTDFELKKS